MKAAGCAKAMKKESLNPHFWLTSKNAQEQ